MCRSSSPVSENLIDISWAVNSVAWAPHTYGLMLAVGAADGTVLVLTYTDQAKTWMTESFVAHPNGVSAVSWCGAASEPP